MNKKNKVLIVDDSPTVRLLIEKHLGENYECLVASNGIEGWETLLQDESIILVFADMHMPVLNGMMLLKRMRESDIERIASIPVIIITGHEDSDAARRASYNIGATDFISKPFVKSDILRCARSYTRQDRVITTTESDIAKDVLNELHDNRVLSKFGSKTIAFSERHNTHTSVMYVQIAHVADLIQNHGSNFISKMADSISGLLEESLREEEIISVVGTGKYTIVLPGTSAFKANIVANRLRNMVERRSFQFTDSIEKCSLAIGITSTESGEAENEYLTFGEYCIQAQHALNMSLESRKNYVIRFDETYEKKFQNESSHKQSKHNCSFVKKKDEEINTVEISDYSDMLSDILLGDYDKISASSLATIVEPLEKFLAYAKAVNNSNDLKKVGL